MRTRFPLARFYRPGSRTLNFHSVRDIKPTPLPLYPWPAIDRAQEMFLELSESVPVATLSINPKNILGPIRVDLYSREHDLNRKNILGAIRGFAPLPDRSAKQKNVPGPKQDRWMRA